MSACRISHAAQRDLHEIWSYIRFHDERAADRLLDAIEQRFQILTTQPEVGQARPDIAPALRFLPVGNYLIFYRPTEEGVEIARVIHGARDYGPDFF